MAESLGSNDASRASQEVELDVDIIDALLPCRRFVVKYRVAELGSVALVSEFMLRLVHTVEGILEDEAAEYFGFTDSEAAYVVDDVVALGFVERRNGTLWLTLAGRELFKPGDDTPQIFEMEVRTERHAFDLISLAPVEFASLTKFDAVLPELKVPPEKAASASKLVPNAFRRHFETLVRRVNRIPLRQSLCSVDLVTPLNRYATTVPIRIKAKVSVPGAVEPDVSDLWDGYDLDDRPEIVQATTELLKASKIFGSDLDNVLFQSLAEVAPEITSEYTKGRAFRREAFFRDTARRAGELRRDRPTTPIVGSLWTDGNLARVHRALDYAMEIRKPDKGVPPILWHVPLGPLWGASKRLPQLLSFLEQAGGSWADAEPGFSAAFVQDRATRHVDRAFSAVLQSRANTRSLGRLEILLVPGLIAAVLVHASLVVGEAYPVQLGVLSFNDAVLSRVSKLLDDLVMPLQVLRTAVDDGLLRRTTEVSLA